jgi:UTP--glucose-1-phosphate uridylyltransferase
MLQRNRNETSTSALSAKALHALLSGSLMSTRKIRKAVIPAAGFGTRMLPATKSIPKELLTVVDRPVLDYIVSEAFDSGIEHIVIVTGRNKAAIEDHFDQAFELDVSLRRSGKHQIADQLARRTPGVGAVSFVRQQEARGLGHAIWTARHVIGDEPFAVMLPDMLMVDARPCLGSLIAVHDRFGGNAIAVQKCDPAEAHKFGIVSLKPTADGPLVNGLVEKPAPGTAPTNFFISGRYVLQPEIFAILENQTPGAGGEIQLTDALIELMGSQEIRPFEFAGRTFDCGSPAGFVSANIHLALARTDIGAEIAEEIDAIAAMRGSLVQGQAA